MDKAVRVFDMFCGAGGSSRGAAMAGAVPVGAVDHWDLAVKTYRLNFPNAIVYRRAVGSLRPHQVQSDVGDIDMLVASPECTSHSVAKGSAPRCEISRALAFEIIRFARSLEPRWIVVENVVHMTYWPRFNEWLARLSALGYKTKVAVIDSQDHGTAQSRKRLFVIGDREAEPELPRSIPGRKRTVSSILGQGQSRAYPWAFRPVKSPHRAVATLERARRAVRALGAGREFIMVYYGSDGAGGFQALDRPLRTITTLDRFAYVRPNGSGYEMRMLQPPELAAAMGFPQHHAWPETSRRNKIKLIGNAVCPSVMRDIVRNLTSRG